jgi:hypothetical protein
MPILIAATRTRDRFTDDTPPAVHGNVTGIAALATALAIPPVVEGLGAPGAGLGVSALGTAPLGA